jgi:hypothetical protein
LDVIAIEEEKLKLTARLGMMESDERMNNNYKSEV